MLSASQFAADIKLAAARRLLSALIPSSIFELADLNL